jgi:hypothetical protein
LLERFREFQRFQMEHLGAVTERSEQLERAYRRRSTGAGEDVLAQLVALGVVRFRHSRLPGAKAAGMWIATHQRDAQFPGTTTSCPRLASWGPTTRLILGPAIGSSQAAEDALRTQLKQPPRLRRLHLNQRDQRPADPPLPALELPKSLARRGYWS